MMITFNTWDEYWAYIKSLPTDFERIDALFNDSIIVLEEV